MNAATETVFLPQLAVTPAKPTALAAPSSLPGRSTRLLFQDETGALFHASPAGWEAVPVVLPAEGRVQAAAAGREHVVVLMEDAPGASTLAFTGVAEDAWTAWWLPFACKPFASLTPAGDVVVTLESGAVVLLHLDSRSVTPLSAAGFARQVHAGADGSLWAVRDRAGFGGGCAVAVRAPGAAEWFTLPDPAAALKVVALSDGTAYGMNPLGEVWRFHPNGVGSFAECSEDPDCRNCLFSERRAGCSDLALGPDDVVWTVSATGRACVLDSRRRVSFEAPLEGVRAVFGSYAA